MDAGPDVQTERADTVRDRACTPDCCGRLAERCEEPVARRVELTAPVALQRSSNDRVMASDHFLPASVAYLSGEHGGIDDVGEQHSSQDARAGTSPHDIRQYPSMDMLARHG